MPGWDAKRYSPIIVDNGYTKKKLTKIKKELKQKLGKSVSYGLVIRTLVELHEDENRRR